MGHVCACLKTGVACREIEVLVRSAHNNNGIIQTVERNLDESITDKPSS
jgi:hypothetical protein